MTFWDLAQVLVRYWALVLVGALATLGVAAVASHQDGVYFSRTQLVFLAPTSSLYPNALRTQSEDLIDTAGVVAKRVSGSGEVTKFASTDVTLAALGVRDGWSLRLPDTGGQWATNFPTQSLLLDIVGPSRDVVAQRQQEIVGKVRDSLNELQRNAGVDPVNDITVITAPETSVIYQVGGSRPRVIAMTFVLGASATLAMVMGVGRRRRRRLRLRRGQPAPVRARRTAVPQLHR